jgi:Fuc2NAc and GlcNAc transferase
MDLATTHGALMTAVLSLCALVLTWLVTGLIRRLALLHGLVDIPNNRSSHRVATPRGGGVSIVLAVSAALVIIVHFGATRGGLFLALIGGGIAVAIAGLVDDRRRLSPGIRLAVHIAAAVWALVWLGGLPALRLGDHLVALGWLGYVLGFLGIVWVTNLFNFMDGIDGIAASEATFVTWSGALLATSAASGVIAPALVLGAACLGFLFWNWSPAQIFMGDVGSGYLGYALAVFALAAARTDPAAVWVWLILGGLFLVDATVTLVRRLARRERVYQAHRSHAYQRLASRWGSHRRVTVSALVVDVVWLLPCAVFATLHPSLGAVTTLVALAPLLAVALIAGSGRSEQPDRATI